MSDENRIITRDDIDQMNTEDLKFITNNLNGHDENLKKLIFKNNIFLYDKNKFTDLDINKMDSEELNFLINKCELKEDSDPYKMKETLKEYLNDESNKKLNKALFSELKKKFNAKLKKEIIKQINIFEKRDNLTDLDIDKMDTKDLKFLINKCKLKKNFNSDKMKETLKQYIKNKPDNTLLLELKKNFKEKVKENKIKIDNCRPLSFTIPYLFSFIPGTAVGGIIVIATAITSVAVIPAIMVATGFIGVCGYFAVKGIMDLSYSNEINSGLKKVNDKKNDKENVIQLNKILQLNSDLPFFSKTAQTKNFKKILNKTEIIKNPKTQINFIQNVLKASKEQIVLKKGFLYSRIDYLKELSDTLLKVTKNLNNIKDPIEKENALKYIEETKNFIVEQKKNM